jgi:hypothetical protein
MSGKIQEDELDAAAAEFINTFNDFKKAAKKLAVIMDSIREKNFQELRGLPGETQQTHDFLIQMMDDNGQIGGRCFCIRCVVGEEKRQG